MSEEDFRKVVEAHPEKYPNTARRWGIFTEEQFRDFVEAHPEHYRFDARLMGALDDEFFEVVKANPTRYPNMAVCMGIQQKGEAISNAQISS
jgi:hypothetical protein